MTPTVVSALVTADMRAQYEREGYFVLDRVLRDDQLELLRGGATGVCYFGSDQGIPMTADGSPPSREYERFLDSGNVVARP